MRTLNAMAEDLPTGRWRRAAKVGRLAGGQTARNYANGYDQVSWAMEPLHFDDQRERMRMQQMAAQGKAN